MYLHRVFETILGTLRSSSKCFVDTYLLGISPSEFKSIISEDIGLGGQHHIVPKIPEIEKLLLEKAKIIKGYGGEGAPRGNEENDTTTLIAALNSAQSDEKALNCDVELKQEKLMNILYLISSTLKQLTIVGW